MYKSWHIYIIAFKPSKDLPWTHIPLKNKHKALGMAPKVCAGGTGGQASVKLFNADSPGTFFAAWKNQNGVAIRDWRPVLISHGNLKLYKRLYPDDSESIEEILSYE